MTHIKSSESFQSKNMEIICRGAFQLTICRSAGVTDMGLKFLLSFGAWDKPWEDSENLSLRKEATSGLCTSLKRVSIKETACTHIGSVFLIVHCSGLEIFLRIY